jgi:hypothetical protein
LGKETGFLHQDFGWDAKIIKETRFLGSGKGRIAFFLKELADGKWLKLQGVIVIG